MVRLLNQADWGEDRGRIQRLKGWVYYPLLLEAYDTLQEEALFPSAIHGPAHIHRVLLLSALVCQGEGVGERMVRQVFRAASYHDVGRTFDGYDVDHGARSALRLAELTGQTGEALRELQAAVTAHARPDREMEAVVASFHPQNLPQALELTRLLKDADNLDPGAPGRSGPPVPPAQQCQRPYGLCPNASSSAIPGRGAKGGPGGPKDKKFREIGRNTAGTAGKSYRICQGKGGLAPLYFWKGG